jgi:hypothetical protein
MPSIAIAAAVFLGIIGVAAALMHAASWATMPDGWITPTCPPAFLPPPPITPNKVITYDPARSVSIEFDFNATPPMASWDQPK